MLAYSKDSLFSLPKLFAYRNEVDVYTEDNIEDKEFYRMLLLRLTESSRKKICDVTPLGSKKNVLEAYGRNQSSPRKALYIVDGDIDILLQANPKNNKHLVYLDRYCIENYLFCETAAIELAHMISYSKEKSTIKKRLNFPNYYTPYIKPILDLYTVFAISYKYDVGMEFTTLPCFWGKNGKDCIKEINKRTEEIEKLIKIFLSQKGLNSEEIFKQEAMVIRKAWPYSIETFAVVVSGKDYLLHLLRQHISSATEGKKVLLQKEAFKLFLVKNCSLESLAFLKKVIEEI